jgi:hypothetical protein
MKSTVLIDDDLMQFVVDMAKHNGVSIQSYLNSLLEKGIVKEMKEYESCKTTDPWERDNQGNDTTSKDNESFCPQFGYDQAVRETEQGT